MLTMLIPKFQDIAIANYSSWIFLKLISFFDHFLILFHFVTVSDNWKVGPRIRDFWWGPRPSIRDPSHRKDQGTLNMGPDTRDPGHCESENFLVFSEAWRLWMNSCALCVYVYFVCFLLPYVTAWTLLIFYQLLFPSCWKKQLLENLISTMQLL